MLQADSGGPLMVGDQGHITVVGVISTGIGCAQPKLPGLYTRVSNYSTWIRTHVQAPWRHLYIWLWWSPILSPTSTRERLLHVDQKARVGTVISSRHMDPVTRSQNCLASIHVCPAISRGSEHKCSHSDVIWTHGSGHAKLKTPFLNTRVQLFQVDQNTRAVTVTSFEHMDLFSPNLKHQASRHVSSYSTWIRTHATSWRNFIMWIWCQHSHSLRQDGVTLQECGRKVCKGK
jgi:hypothetical protein